MSSEYQALLSKVEAFAATAQARRAADFACRAGCSACCEAWLSVSPIEAEAIRARIRGLPEQARTALAQRGRRELLREQRGEPRARCAMLAPDGTCSIYATRPLLCRTQGHALRYPPGVIPAETVRARLPGGDVTHCPLNYAGSPPSAADSLDAERVDTLLSLINARFCAQHRRDPLARETLSALAAEAMR